MFSTYGFRVPAGGGTQCDDETDMTTDVHTVRTIVDAMRCSNNHLGIQRTVLDVPFAAAVLCRCRLSRKVIFFAWFRV